ncbi:hypothetical protein PFISCL1PPCAC_15150, partial [Pristionchus fissidentatus]
EFSHRVKEQNINLLKDGEASIIFDFGQKFLPKKFREAQSDYFGKSGLSFHVSHVHANIGGRIAQHQAIHIITNDRQDSGAVIQIIHHLLGELKKKGIRSVYLRSDNAGAYHSSTTIAAVYVISKEVGVRVIAYDFSESQNGKSAADRVSGMVKNKVRAYVDAGKDAKSHEQFFTAATSGRLLEATSFYLVSAAVQKLPAVKIPKISEMNDFQYVKNGLREWRHLYNGDGTFISASSFEELFKLIPIEVLKKAGHLPEDFLGYWKILPRLKDATCPKDDYHSLWTSTERKAFYCPEIICSASFDTSDELEAHWLTGQHCSSPSTTTMRDEALRMYAIELEGVASHRLNIPDIDDSIKELEKTASDDEENEEYGWSLKSKKVVRRFTEKAKKYIIALFDEGIVRGNHVTPEEAERRMFNEREKGVRVFEEEERMDSRQIASMFSRIASIRQKEKVMAKMKEKSMETKNNKGEEKKGSEDKHDGKGRKPRAAEGDETETEQQLEKEEWVEGLELWQRLGDFENEDDWEYIRICRLRRRRRPHCSQSLQCSSRDLR